MIKHPAFLTRPHYRTSHTLPALRRQAKQQRMAGFYNIATLWLYRCCWQQSGKLEDYLNYLAFRRDLGYPVSTKQQQRIAKWHKNAITRLCWSWLNRSAAHLRKKLLKVPTQQSELQQELMQVMSEKAAIQLVGNSANLINANLGAMIDRSPLVLRFNRCFSEETRPEDTGLKTDIWVCAPDFKFGAPKHDWCVLTGPDMLNWLSRLPAAIKKRRDILSVPLSVWRELVRELAAPPSAGLLTLRFLRQLVPQCQLNVTGFSFNDAANQYHHADKNHKAVSRHNWLKEQEILSRWLALSIIALSTEETAN
ncbi:MAG: glycosyltransferase family 29 protein [Paraglaciecola sp.]|nr:glycosyltransferase family 29 protein [Paraglaciecola sp.]